MTKIPKTDKTKKSLKMGHVVESTKMSFFAQAVNN